jgi:mRNA interferase RelE/StbE
MYRIVVEQRVYKDLDKLPAKELDKIYKTISRLENDPRPVGVKKLRGHHDRYRIRQGDYRVVYTVDDASKVVRIFLVRHRKDVYKI